MLILFSSFWVLVTMDEDLENIDIACNTCGNVFLFTVGEQRFYRNKGLANRPKRCRACRFARKAVRDQGGSGNAPARVTPAPPPRASYSLPISTVPGLVLESDAKRFVAAVDDDRILQVRSGRCLTPGTCVTFTRSTTKGDYLLHDVLDLPPVTSRKARMKATVNVVEADHVVLRVHYNNEVLECASPSSFSVEKGQRVLFAVGWSEAGLTAESITELDLSKLSYSPGYAWKSPLGLSETATSAMMEIIHPSASLHLSKALGYTHDFCCHPLLSPANFAFADELRRGAVPRLSLLRMEEQAATGTWPRDQAPGDSEFGVDHKAIPTYLLRGSRSTGHLLAEYLKRNFSEIDSLGLERRVVVLYPVDEGTTADNFYGTTSSKLFRSRILPITKIEVLTEPVPVAKAFLKSAALTGQITSRRMVAVHYEISRNVSLPPWPPVTSLDTVVGDIDGEVDLLEVKTSHALNASVKFSIPKGAVGATALREALPRGTLLHSVGHSMGASYSTYEAVFADDDAATRFVGIIGAANRSDKEDGQWLAAPLSEYWGGERVYTMFTSKNFRKDDFYQIFGATWAFAVNHTQIRFCSNFTLKGICEIADRINSSSRKGLTFLRLYGDGRGFIQFNRRTPSVPCFPGDTPPLDADVPGHVGAPAMGTTLYLHSIPRTLPLSAIENLVHSMEPEATRVSIFHFDGTLSASFKITDASKCHELLAAPCRRLGKHYLYLSPNGGNHKDSTPSHRCSGSQDMSENMFFNNVSSAPCRQRDVTNCQE